MKILVADDVPENRILLQKLLARMQHQVVLAEDGEQAVEVFRREAPDLILMDIMMPRMNGLDAIRAIRAEATDRWVPIFAISALAEINDVVNGLQAGADDYLPKPFNQAVLSAKLLSAQRSVAMQKRIVEDSRQLQAYRDQNEAEQQFLQGLIERMTRQNDLNDRSLAVWLMPAQRFSGDLLSARRISSGQIYFLLADACGEGLAAALPTVIIHQAFQSMTKKGLSITVIIREINRLLGVQMPPGHTVAIAVGIVDSQRNSIELWNGGLPDLLALDGDGQPLFRFESRHPPAGTVNDREFSDRCEVWHWPQSCQLLMYSDGLIAAENGEGQPFGRERLLEIAAGAPPARRVAELTQALTAHIGDRNVADDISCMTINCG
ncbi:hypothetical protein BJL95_14665 [Methylomonas sp. LWB]|uniref:SpoIIE family protein phosphatase n=1 Tax=Methylomonas sp. LWB TaxID=1905845 RepID=UPI0008D97A61|nr:SpoIIE family protein phosphatase [Methylomonas sp. LWB]OHX35483.1 hypothetical protein BJL95_14665 [Methylomonas sp. LWB]